MKLEEDDLLDSNKSILSQKTMKIAVIIRDKIELCPPMISVVEILSDLGEEVTLITSEISDDNRKRFVDKGISIDIIPYEITSNIIKRVVRVLSYRRLLQKELKNGGFDLLWIEGAGTFRNTVGIIEKYPFIMQISELYDYPEAEPVVKAISKLIHYAKAVVMPEYHRSLIYKSMYSLKDSPFVLPNKPYYSLGGEELKKYEDKYQALLEIFREKKVILYQGILSEERNLVPYIKAVSKLDKDYVMVLLGPDQGMLQEYKKINPDIIHIDFIPSPDYFVFTANAYIGILTYTPDSLNCLFCAPNKIYEYGCYGLPMIGNDIPGLSGTIGKHDAGVLVDETEESIVNGIKKIEEEYDYFSRNARRLFDETNNYNMVKAIIHNVK